MLRDLAAFGPMLKPAVTGSVLLFAWLVLLGSIANLVLATFGQRWRVALSGAEHWLLLGIAGLLYVVR